MQYLVYTFSNFTSQDHSEILIAFLDEIGYSGFIEDEDTLIAYLQESEKNEEYLANLLKKIAPEDSSIEFKVDSISEQNWNAIWESGFQPIEVSNQVRIRASFHKKDASFLYDLLIDPKMSFGTGHHETTRLMIKTMLNYSFKDKKILDLGCGTGVLGILASKMKAKSVVAADVDQWAFDNTSENIQSNQCSNVSVWKGGIEIVPNQEFQIILANINRNVLLDYMVDFHEKLSDKGLLILSGIMEPDLKIIKESADDLDFIQVDKNNEKNWHCLVFKVNKK